MIYDVPGDIPDDIAQHLKTDVERLMYKQAMRAIHLCLDNDIHDGDWSHPKNLLKDLQGIAESDITHRAMKTVNNMRIISEALFEAYMNLGDMKYLDTGEILRDMDQIVSDLDMHENWQAELKEMRRNRLQKIKDDPDTVEVKGSHGEVYFVNKEENCCTCLGFKYRGNCKHLKKRIL